jgi:hypothetical protein
LVGRAGPAVSGLRGTHPLFSTPMIGDRVPAPTAAALYLDGLFARSDDDFADFISASNEEVYSGCDEATRERNRLLAGGAAAAASLAIMQAFAGIPEREFLSPRARGEQCLPADPARSTLARSLRTSDL